MRTGFKPGFRRGSGAWRFHYGTFLAAALLMSTWAAVPFAFSAWAVEGLAAGPLCIVENQQTDFGIQLRYSPLVWSIRVKNAGQETLKAAVGKKACSCTVETQGAIEVPPGASDELTLTYLPKDWEKGMREVRVEIETNDPEKRHIEAKAKAYLVDEVYAEPDRLSLDPVSCCGRLTIYRMGESQLRPQVTGFRVADNRLQVSRLSTEDFPDRQIDVYEVVLRGEVEDFQTGIVSFDLNSSCVPELQVPVFLSRPSVFTASPSHLLFGVLKSGQTYEKHVQLALRHDAVVLSTCRSSSDSFEPVVSLDRETNQWFLRVKTKPFEVSDTVSVKAHITVYDSNGSCAGILPVFATLIP